MEMSSRKSIQPRNYKGKEPSSRSNFKCAHLYAMPIAMKQKGKRAGCGLAANFLTPRAALLLCKALHKQKARRPVKKLRALFQLSGVEFYRQQNGFPPLCDRVCVLTLLLRAMRKYRKISESRRKFLPRRATVKQIGPAAAAGADSSGTFCFLPFGAA